MSPRLLRAFHYLRKRGSVIYAIKANINIIIPAIPSPIEKYEELLLRSIMRITNATVTSNQAIGVDTMNQKRYSGKLIITV